MAIWWRRGVMTKKYQVKLKGVRLEVEGSKVLFQEREKSVITIEIKWEGPPLPPPKSGFASFYRKSNQTRSSIFKQDIKRLKLGQESTIDEGVEFDHTCVFSINSKDPKSFDPWIVSFHIFSGESEEKPSSSSSSSRTKMQVIGVGELNLGELASKMEAQIEQKIPLILQVDGVQSKSNLRVVVSFTEMTSSHSRTESLGSFEIVENSGDSTVILRRAMSQGGSLTQQKDKKGKIKLFGKQLSFRNSNESPATLISEKEYVVVASNSKVDKSNSMTELGNRPSLETQLDLAKKGGFWKWKRRRSKKKLDINDSNIQDETENISNSGSWEPKELRSRDGKTKLEAHVFFASFDQRDEKAAGEAACAAIVAIKAHWLLMNPGKMPTRSELDRLIIEGSLEWRKLCQDDNHRAFFPDRHFDIETIVGAELRPLVVPNSGSRIGFFHSERFEHLKDARSFDDIWEEINEHMNKCVPRVYIVRWNDHFFILKLEANANYIIDSLGERLHEGCTRAYILRFDDSAIMYEDGEEEGEDRSVICQGKECCKEYMKRFLAAITLREFIEEEEKGRKVEVAALCQRLQIDFHLCNPSSIDVSNASTSVSPSPDTSPCFPYK